MARSWQYPRWRRYVMQAMMWVVLGATLALAAFANHERRRALRVELGPVTGYGTLGVRLPRAWAVVPPSGAAAADSRVVVRAAEPSPGVAPGSPTVATTDDGAGRIVTVYRERLTAAATPLEHVLSRPEGRRLELLDAYRGRPLDPVEPIRVGEWPGVLVRAIRAPAASAAPGAAAGAADGAAASAPRPRKELYACAVLPSRHAVVIKLEGDGPPELSDAEVLKQIAAAVDVTAAGQPGLGQPGETISIDGHTRLAAPEGYRPVYEADPQRTERRLWSSTDDGTAWACADLVPCVLAPDDAGDVIDDDDDNGASRARGPAVPPRTDMHPPRDASVTARNPIGGAPASIADAAALTQAIRTIVATRDPRLRSAAIEPVAAGAGRAAWRIVPQASASDEAFPTRAYLLAEAADDDDASPADNTSRAAAPRRALLAVFHGDRGRGAAASFDAAWAAMAGTVDFVGPSHLPRMLAAGEAEVRRLRALGVPRLLGTGGEQWWLWFDDAAKRNIGWSSAVWSVPDPSNPGGATGRRQTLWRTPAGQLARATDEWWGDLRNYTSYTDAAGDDATISAAPPAGIGGSGAAISSSSSSAASAGPGEPPAAGWASAAEAPKQITTLGGHQLTTEWSARDRKLGTWRRPAPPQYVPGGWLALLVPYLSPGDGPFVLRTESFPGYEGARPPEPMLLIVTPEPAGAAAGAATTANSPSTRGSAAASAAVDATLRCIAVRVNGTGQIARWYIRPDGTPARVDLAGGLQRLPSDLKTIKFTFGHDGSMVP